jgi:hypothetical protein
MRRAGEVLVCDSILWQLRIPGYPLPRPPRLLTKRRSQFLDDVFQFRSLGRSNRFRATILDVIFESALHGLILKTVSHIELWFDTADTVYTLSSLSQTPGWGRLPSRHPGVMGTGAKHGARFGRPESEDERGQNYKQPGLPVPFHSALM